MKPILLLSLMLAAAPAWAQEATDTAAMPAEAVSVAPPAVSITAVGAEGLPQLPPRELFDEIVARPLFNVARRPLAASASDGSVEALRERWKLTGVVRTDARLQALFAEREGEVRKRLDSGMPLDENWLIEAIEPLAVVVSNSEQRVRLELFEPRDIAPEALTPAQDEAPGDPPPASIEERTQGAVEQVRERVEALTGGSS